MSSGELTLREIQDALGVPQHVLIHLCEKGLLSQILLRRRVEAFGGDSLSVTFCSLRLR